MGECGNSIARLFGKMGHHQDTEVAPLSDDHHSKLDISKLETPHVAKMSSSRLGHSARPAKSPNPASHKRIQDLSHLPDP
jgi:hypothetical protein